MPIVTISRHFGSGGSLVAKAVARRLGWHVVDQEFIGLVAERAGLPPEEVAVREERVESLIERLARTLSVSAPEVFIAAAQPTDLETPEEEIRRATERIIAEAAQQGDVVLVGRGAQAYLGARDDALHVFVTAPRDVRIERTAERLELSRKDAEKRLATADEGRRHYVETHYQRSWEDPTRYHLVINTGLVPYDEAAEVIADAARRRWPPASPPR